MSRSLSLSGLLCSILFPAVTLAFRCEKGLEQAEFRLDFEKYTLANGLEVVLQEDRSDPMVAVVTLEEHRRISQEYLRPERLTYVIVGDAATQLPGLEGLGLGNPVLLDRDGNPVMQ